jgi:DNA-binding NarL/FixJ family response regulator
MRVLLIEDHAPLAGLVGRELQRECGWEVTYARDPREVSAHDRASFDLAIIDLLYEHLTRDFDSRRLAGAVTLTGKELLLSGLAAVRDLAADPAGTRFVIWTSGEASRRLHLLFAYEEFAARVFCSKSAGTGTLDTLIEALRAAADKRGYVDPVLNSYLPADGARTISSTILHDPARRSVWRALALGARTRGQVSDITGYSSRHVGNLIPEMFNDLSAFDAGLRTSSSPMNEVISYASRNWEFFLDDTVRQVYP